MHTRSQNVWNKIALLSILDGAHTANKAPADNFAIQKLTFLSELTGRSKNLKTAYYKFFRYTYGPYSSGLANDVRSLETLRLIDPESRELTDRGRYLLSYTRAETEQSETAMASLATIGEIVEGWGWLRGWHIVDKVYELSVPVDDLNGEKIRVKDIPLHTDILVPDKSDERDAIHFSEEMVGDVEAELSIPPSRLDPDCPELIESVAAGLEAALAL
jgi:hypothetical protein